MKKLLFCLFFIILANFSFAQLSIITNYRQDGIWDNKNEKWDVLSTDGGTTTFEFNTELTQFKHTTPTITSNYDILEYKYDEEAAKYTMTVKSEVGNKYEMIVDGINNCVAFFYWKKDDYILVRHTIKETFIRK